mgnify:CR=1 FL=1|jgi:hypothetical protein
MDENLSEPLHSEQPKEKKKRGRPPAAVAVAETETPPAEEKVAIRLTHDYWHYETAERLKAGSVIELPKKWAKQLVDNKKAELTIDW